MEIKYFADEVKRLVEIYKECGIEIDVFLLTKLTQICFGYQDSTGMLDSFMPILSNLMNKDERLFDQTPDNDVIMQEIKEEVVTDA